jgi:hypothetical protein
VLQLTEQLVELTRRFYPSQSTEKVESLGSTNDGEGGHYLALYVDEGGTEQFYVPPTFPPNPLDFVPSSTQTIVWRQI